ncbi:aminotransferase [Emericellopsis atlantica]|uniref:Aminotransferase n=1 Tax=Emericellopsis atlantica TaxID=2614577 RepID=A0A9P7ZP67_9HYPO|nr:aminotransferase [Emericellopsis atlantica]KAG9255123.1 aminotransferase [Emericellopsis atlantica]
MPDLINLQLGWPSPSLFPAADLLNGASSILESPKKTAAALIYGPDAGYEPLREQIALWLSSTYNIKSTPERICVSSGASANLANILQKFTEPEYTRRIWMVEPCYFLACPIMTDAGFEGRLRGVPEDEEGLDIDFLRTSIQEVEKSDGHPDTPSVKTNRTRYPRVYKHIIYAVPTFANPSAKTMSLRRREDLVRLAREFDALVVTDDVYDVLRWPEDTQADADAVHLPDVPPRIVDVDRTLDGGPRDDFGNAVSNGSFSKIIAPGVRTGWNEAMPAFAHALSSLGSTKSGGCPSHMSATFVAEMLASGQLQSHIKDTLVPTYRARYNTLFRVIREHLLPLGFHISTGKPYAYGHISNGATNGHAQSGVVVGGYFTYLTVPDDLPITADQLAARGLEKYDLKFASGGMMTVEGDEGSRERAVKGYGRGIRLCWAWHTEAEIQEGIERLASLVKEVRP